MSFLKPLKPILTGCTAHCKMSFHTACTDEVTAVPPKNPVSVIGVVVCTQNDIQQLLHS